MFSNRKIEKFDSRAPEFLQDLAQNPRVQQIAGKVRTATQDGKPVPKMKLYNIRDGIFEALLYRFAIDPTMVAFGEENRDWGGAFAAVRAECHKGARPRGVAQAGASQRELPWRRTGAYMRASRVSTPRRR